MKYLKWHAVVIAIACVFAQPVWAGVKPFYLHSGDRVLFYGDSITQQRYYPVAIETYVRTRFPNLKVRFVDSAVGGARVTGNWATSSEKQSLERDVYPFKPNVVTIMLGMNDGEYRPFNQSVFHTYVAGYEYIIAQLEQHLPGVKIVLIEPSPWDDYTHKPFYPHNPAPPVKTYVLLMPHFSEYLICLIHHGSLVASKVNTVGELLLRKSPYTATINR